MRQVKRGIVAAAVALCPSCGGSDTSPTSPSPNPGGGSQATITIGADGIASPRSVTIAPGGRVTFVNSHNRSHDMASDPHPEHTDCPEINQVGFLQPG